MVNPQNWPKAETDRLSMGQPVFVHHTTEADKQVDNPAPLVVFDKDPNRRYISGSADVTDHAPRFRVHLREYEQVISDLAHPTPGGTGWETHLVIYNPDEGPALFGVFQSAPITPNNKKETDQ
jgi:hypothetical protein